MQIESMEDFAKSGNMLKYSLFPIKDIHLHSSRTVELGVNGNIQYVYIFSAVALFILLIACINFMNLSTARSAGRAKEVGIRKVLGTEKKALIGQFLTESTLMAFISTLLAISIIWISMPWFNTMAGKQLEFTILFKPQYILFLFSLPIVIGILAGSYPAFYLSAFQPISVLKGKLNAGSKKNGLRNFLVVFQFATSIILIIGTIIVYQQLKFIQNTNLGFNKDQVLVVNNPGIRGENREVFKNEIAKLSGIKSASFAGYLPVSNSSRNDNTFSPDAVMNEKNGFNMQSWSVDYDYIPTFGMEIIKGRNFSKEYGSDSAAIIINESTAAVLGPDEPIGKYLYTNDGGSPNSTTALQIIGVVKNFHYESLRKNVGPLSMRLGNNRWASAYRVDTKDINQLVKNIELKYKEMAPGMPFSYQFLDDSFDEMYREDQRIGQVSLNFAFLAILIACMGLLGLATYTMEQRTKEIGVRKVLGATVANIVKMLSKDFLMLVSISIVIAVPIAWFGMYKWLQEFAFRMDMSIWIFVAAGVVALLIAFITVSFQAIKAALMNPIKSLRTE